VCQLRSRAFRVVLHNRDCTFCAPTARRASGALTAAHSNRFGATPSVSGCARNASSSGALALLPIGLMLRAHVKTKVEATGGSESLTLTIDLTGDASAFDYFLSVRLCNADNLDCLTNSNGSSVTYIRADSSAQPGEPYFVSVRDDGAITNNTESMPFRVGSAQRGRGPTVAAPSELAVDELDLADAPTLVEVGL